MKKLFFFLGAMLLTSIPSFAQLPRVPWTGFVPATQGLPIKGSFPNTVTVCAQYCDYVDTTTAYAYINTQTHDTSTHKWAVLLFPNATDNGGGAPTGVTKLSYTAAAPTTYAASVSAGGPATTATNLASVPTPCTTGALARGVDTGGNSTGCAVTLILAGVGNTASKPATCTAASTTAVSAYLDTQALQLCLCTSTNTWKCGGLS